MISFGSQHAALEPVHTRTGFYMFAFAVWLFIDRSILPLESVVLFAMALALTVLAAQVDWVSGLRRAFTLSDGREQSARFRAADGWSWDGMALPAADTAGRSVRQ